MRVLPSYIYLCIRFMPGTCGGQSPGQLGATNWVLGIKLGSSRGVISALKLCTTSPAPRKMLY